MAYPLKTGDHVRLKSAPSDVQLHAKVLGPAPNSWRVELSNRTEITVDETDIDWASTDAADAPTKSEGTDNEAGYWRDLDCLGHHIARGDEWSLQRQAARIVASMPDDLLNYKQPALLNIARAFLRQTLKNRTLNDGTIPF